MNRSAVTSLRTRHRSGKLVQLPGFGPVTAAVVLAEIGVDMNRFPTAGHPRKTKTGHGNRYLARALGDVVVMAGRSQTFLGEH